MKHSAIVVIDREKARFLSLEPHHEESSHGRSHLVERRDLPNSHWKQLQLAGKIDPSRGSDSSVGTSSLFRTSGRQTVAGEYVPRSSFGDSVQAEEINALHLFAKELSVEIRNFLKEERCEKLFLVCGPKLMGQIRSDLPKKSGLGCEIIEIEKNFSNLDSPKIHDVLANNGFIPRRNLDPELRKGHFQYKRKNIINRES